MTGTISQMDDAALPKLVELVTGAARQISQEVGYRHAARSHHAAGR